MKFCRSWGPVSALVTVVLWACTSNIYRDAEGVLKREFCVAIAGGLVLFVMGMAWGTAWARTAFWASIALLGSAVTLQMIDAGPQVRYQHYRLSFTPWQGAFVL